MSPPLLLIRHAIAVDRDDWPGDDNLRPLTAEGERQAEVLCHWLSRFDVSLLLSSPTVRCVATLEPYARLHRTVVVRRPELLPGRIADAAALTRRMLAAGGVLCTHGEVIEPLLEALAVDRLTAPSGSSAKGSVWVLEQADERVTGRYISPEQVESEVQLNQVGRGLTEG